MIFPKESTYDPHLVWVRGLRGPEAQKWIVIDYGVGRWKQKNILAMHRVAAGDVDKTIAELELIFPAPAFDPLEQGDQQ